jgi:hypothetical protein
MKSAFVFLIVLQWTDFALAQSKKPVHSIEWAFYSHGAKILVYEEQLPTHEKMHVVKYRGAAIHNESVSIDAPYVEGFYRSSDFKDVPEEISYLLLNSYAGDGCPSKYSLIKFSVTKQQVFNDIGNCDPVEKIQLDAKGLHLSFKNNPLIPGRNAQSHIF